MTNKNPSSPDVLNRSLSSARAGAKSLRHGLAALTLLVGGFANAATASETAVDALPNNASAIPPVESLGMVSVLPQTDPA